MFSKPWKIKDGILVGCGLIVVGLLLQYLSGRIEWEIFAWPVNILAVVFLIIVSLVIHLLRSRFGFCGWISSLASAVPAIGFSLALTIVMGLTQMLRFWPFVLCYTWMVLTLMTTVIRRISTFKWKKDIPFMLSHIGLILVIVCGTLGSADLRQLEMTVTEGKTESKAVSEVDRSLQDPGLSVFLKDFSIDEYPPKVYVVDRASRKIVNRAEFISAEVVPSSQNLSGWEVTVEKALPFAAPAEDLIRKDSISFELWEGDGAVHALFVNARKDGISKEGWITPGSHIFDARVLELDDNLALRVFSPAPRRFSADIEVTSRKGKRVEKTIAVNEPLKIDGWKVYLVDYDNERGRWSKIAVFELVRDPWLPFVYIGIFMLLAGAVCMLSLSGGRKTNGKS